MPSKQSVNSFRPDVQGLRFIAVTLVVLYHGNLPFLSGGFIGVDIFFVISGFLITTHILQALIHADFSFSKFYANRVRRILPASLAVIILSLAIAWIVLPPLQLARVSRDAVWTALYMPNILFAREGTNYLAAPEPSLFQHYWSLGIEEQFYLLWPLIIWGLYRLTRRNLNVVFWATSGIVGLSFLGSVLLTPGNQSWAFFLLPTRAWELGIGGLVAFALLKGLPNFNELTKNIIASISLCVLIFSALSFDHRTIFPSYSAALPVIATAAIIYAGPYHGVIAMLLQNRLALWIGKISYSVYLVHWPLLVLPVAAASWSITLELWQSLLLSVLALPLGWLSYRFIETPFRKSRMQTRRAVWTPLVTAIIGGLIVSTVAVVGMRAIPPMNLNVGKSSPEFVVSADPSPSPFVGDNFSVRLQDFQSEIAVPSGAGCDLSVDSDSAPPACIYGSDQDATSVALVGDSHAAQWAPAFEALASKGSILLTAHTKSGCSLHDRSINGETRETDVCLKWKQAVIDALNQQKPDFIVLTHSVAFLTIPATSYDQAMRALLPQLPSESTIVLVRETPRFKGDPVSCLSQNLAEPKKCSIDRAVALNDEFNAVDQNLIRDFNLKGMDFTNYMCSDKCHVAQGNVLVFKDQQHISKTFSRHMEYVVLEKLKSDS